MDKGKNNDFKDEKLCDELTNYLCLLTQVFSPASLLQTYIYRYHIISQDI